MNWLVADKHFTCIGYSDTTSLLVGEKTAGAACAARLPASSLAFPVALYKDLVVIAGSGVSVLSCCGTFGLARPYKSCVHVMFAHAEGKKCDST